MICTRSIRRFPPSNERYDISVFRHLDATISEHIQPRDTLARRRESDAPVAPEEEASDDDAPQTNRRREFERMREQRYASVFYPRTIPLSRKRSSPVEGASGSARQRPRTTRAPTAATSSTDTQPPDVTIRDEDGDVVMDGGEMNDDAKAHIYD